MPIEEVKRTQQIHLTMPADQIAATLKDCLLQVRPNFQLWTGERHVNTEMSITDGDICPAVVSVIMQGKVVCEIFNYHTWSCCGANHIVFTHALPQEIVDCFFDQCYGKYGKLLLVQSPVLPSKIKLRLSSTFGVYTSESSYVCYRGSDYSSDPYAMFAAICKDSFPEVQIRYHEAVRTVVHTGRYLSLTGFPSLVSIADNVLFLHSLQSLRSNEARILPKFFNECTSAKHILGISTSAQGNLTQERGDPMYVTDLLKEHSLWPVLVDVKNPNTNNRLRLHVYSREENTAPDNPAAKQEVAAATTK